jgi:hypothetical protein
MIYQASFILSTLFKLFKIIFKNLFLILNLLQLVRLIKNYGTLALSASPCFLTKNLTFLSAL